MARALVEAGAPIEVPDQYEQVGTAGAAWPLGAVLRPSAAQPLAELATWHTVASGMHAAQTTQQLLGSS